MMSGRWFRIAPERQLDAVADDVVLVGHDARAAPRLLAASSASSSPCGIEKGLWEKSIFFSSSFHSNIGKVDDPAELEAVLVDQVQLAADHGARLAGELVELVRVAGSEEDRIADLEAELAHLQCASVRSRTEVLGDRRRAVPCPPLVALAPEDVAEAGLAFALRPAVHAVAEGARAAARRRNGPDARLGILLDDARRTP